jgi:CRP-like cAMP-binding protein
MHLTEEEIAKLRIALKKVSFLEHLRFSELDALIHNLEKRSYRRGEVIIRQGDRGDRFYILASGLVGVYRQRVFWRKRVAGLEPGRFFGEMALIDNVKRTATILGEHDGELYSLSRDAFNKVLLSNPGIAKLIQQAAEYRKIHNRAMDMN